jgi:subtilisin family serine protease
VAAKVGIAVTVVALLVAAPAAAGPSLSKAQHSLAQPSAAAGCTTQSYSYDSGGSPGSGAVNDPLFPRQWGLTQINAPQAWARGVKGAGATIAVVDTGVDLNHPDLKSKLVSGADLVAAGGDCPPGPQDENGHGTHVAGIAGAATNNGIGVAGTAPDAKIMPVRVLDADGSGTTDDVAAGIRYAADHGAQVVSMSLGELPVVSQIDPSNQALADAIQYAWDRGSLVVAAAGNESFPLCDSPAFQNHAVCVGATDQRRLPSFYSNFPNNQQMVGVRAPGGAGTPFCENDEDIWSTIWPGSADDCQDSAELNGYDTLAGTSMATPFVSGVAALLYGQGLTNQQIVDKLEQTSSNHGTYDPVMGYGIVDADAATK